MKCSEPTKQYQFILETATKFQRDVSDPYQCQPVTVVCCVLVLQRYGAGCWFASCRVCVMFVVVLL